MVTPGMSSSEFIDAPPGAFELTQFVPFQLKNCPFEAEVIETSSNISNVTSSLINLFPPSALYIPIFLEFAVGGEEKITLAVLTVVASHLTEVKSYGLTTDLHIMPMSLVFKL